VKISFDLVLPNADDAPAHLAQLREVFSVPQSRFLYFGPPKGGKFFPPCGEAITVPEVAVNEYDDHRSRRAGADFAL
jgi:hypothetical protein